MGDKNPTVRIGVADVTSGETRWLDTGESGDVYVPRIYWTSAKDTLAVMTLNRTQNDLKVFFFDVTSGERRLLFEEKSDALDRRVRLFADVQDYLYFPEGARELFWISDRDGRQHIYRYDYDGKLLNQVTQGPWVVTRVEGIDPLTQAIYYTSTESSPLERHLYAIRFDGTGKRRLTPDARDPLRRCVPKRKILHRQLVQRAAAPPSGALVHGRREAGDPGGQCRPRPSGSRVTPTPRASCSASPRQTGVQLDGSMVKPPDFDPTHRYPVLISIYGGPGSQQVYDAFESDGWYQYLAQQGYIVVGLNNRGSGNYGRDFMEVVYLHLGEWESHDFAELAKYMGTQPYVDREHIGIRGTSYGGYSAIYTMLRYPGLFALGIANSPVTDWRLYDSIYTERYMGLLDANQAGYEGSSAIPLAGNLQGHLLLVHSAMDENVHPQNTMQLLTALAVAGKDADLRFYPPGAHGAAFDRNSFVTMNEVYTNALCEYLAQSCIPTNLNE